MVVALALAASVACLVGCKQAKEAFEKNEEQTPSAKATAEHDRHPEAGSTAAVAELKTGIPECDSYLVHYHRCIPDLPADTLRQMSATYRAALADPRKRRRTAASCAQADRRLRTRCP